MFKVCLIGFGIGIAGALIACSLMDDEPERECFKIATFVTSCHHLEDFGETAPHKYSLLVEACDAFVDEYNQTFGKDIRAELSRLTVTWWINFQHPGCVPCSSICADAYNAWVKTYKDRPLGTTGFFRQLTHSILWQTTGKPGYGDHGGMGDNVHPWTDEHTAMVYRLKARFM